VTLQLIAIDIPATDRANREPSGSFLALFKANQTPASDPSTSTTTGPARRTVTNRDLESFANVRRQSERAYEQRRRELGFSAKDELRRRTDAEAQRKILKQTLTEDSATEAYWRERANNLRADMAAVDAEIASVSQQLDSLPQPNQFSSVVIGSGYSPFGVFGNPLLQQTSFYNRYTVTPFGFRRAFRDQYPLFPNFGMGYQPYDVSYERSTLRMRLNELVGQRAGLQARWRILEDEARRAGAYPGWLRP